MSISHSCVDSDFPPSGWLILMGLFDGIMFLAGVLVPGCRKWPAAPASAIPKSLLIWIGLVALLAVSTGVETFMMVTVMFSSSIVASAAY